MQCPPDPLAGGIPSWFALAAVVWLASCVQAPPLDQVLLPRESTEPGQHPTDSVDPVERARTAARQACARAERNPGDAHDQINAARALGSAADLTLFNAQIQLANGQSLTVDDFVSLEDAIPRATKREILGLVTAGYGFATAAQALDRDLQVAEYQATYHLALVAWAEGIGTAALRGRGTELGRRMAELHDLPEALDEAGGLRLRGRFLDRAPWPFGDKDEARELLLRSVEIAPVAINALFLGDALWSAGRSDEAVAAWGLGVDACERRSSSPADGMRCMLLRLRLEAARRESGA